MTSDAELLSLWNGGDTRSGDTLLARHFGSIRRFFANKVDAQTVEELVQRTFTGCIEGATRFRGDASFRAYLFGIARKTLYKHLRTHIRDAEYVDHDVGVSSVRALGQSPTSVVAEQERGVYLLEALQRLPLAQQTLLELHYWEHLGPAAIAEVLEIETGNVRVRLHRARRRLLEEMVTQDGQPPTEDALDTLARALGRVV